MRVLATTAARSSAWKCQRPSGSADASYSNDPGDVERLRNYYNKKIADIEKKSEAALRAAKRGSVGQPVSPTKGGDRNVSYERVKELEQMIAKQVRPSEARAKQHTREGVR